MSHSQDNFKRGTAKMLILHLLQDEDLYGYQITKLFSEKSNSINLQHFCSFFDCNNLPYISFN